MKIAAPLSLASIKTWEDLRRFTAESLSQLLSLVNGRISIQDNLETSVVDATFSASSITVAVPHTLGRVPTGYIVASLSASLIVFNGNKDHTDAVLYVQASAAGTAKLIVF